jgi:hypothetical protein
MAAEPHRPPRTAERVAPGLAPRYVTRRARRPRAEGRLPAGLQRERETSEEEQDNAAAGPRRRSACLRTARKNIATG